MSQSSNLVTLDSRPSVPVPAIASATNRRRILCVFPRYSKSFGTFHHAYRLAGVKAFMPPQGMLVIAAYLPKAWEVRFVDENIRPATRRDFEWAEAVFLSGMHIQREAILELNERAHAHGRITALGGPSVSACPEWYGALDLLHVGELGDATEALVARLDRDVTRPKAQEIYSTQVRVPLEQFPLPAYEQIRPRDYFIGSIQFSSGCPYTCEFCDIPELYGRNPRLKRPEQVTAELDVMLARGNPGAVYFVDDNFIGNRKAAVALLRELIRWQQEKGYPVSFACEATLNLAQATDVLELMREANFVTVFVGIETPEEEALASIQKKQNLRQPILDAIHTLNSYGMEVVSGIIIGFDTDTLQTGDRILDFIRASGIPMLTINILHALPRTQLWRRLEAEGRLSNEPGRESNVVFRLPYEKVVAMWRKTVMAAYEPSDLLQRYARQANSTFRNRKVLPANQARLNPANVRRALAILSRIVWTAGIVSSWRREFWRFALPLLKEGRIEAVLHAGIVSHHLIAFARECASGAGEKCFYGPQEGSTATAGVRQTA